MRRKKQPEEFLANPCPSWIPTAHVECESVKALIQAREKFLLRFDEAIIEHVGSCEEWKHAKKKQRQ